jgi:lipoprotein-anchoring transpeptidase ErfK/SrfK
MDRPSTRKFLLAAFAAALLVLPATAHAVQMPKRDEAVMINRYLMGHAKPSSVSRGTVHLWTNTGYSNRRAVYPVIAHKTAKNGTEWLKVRVVRRPKGVDTWIPAWATTRVWIKYRIVVDLSSRLARIYRSGSLVKRYRVVVGAPNTPTPTGHYYVVDRMRLHTSWANGLWALATSAYSARLKHFDGGDGVIALHARGALSNPVGTAASHGCVRFNNGDIAWMARHIPNGTRIEIQH